MRGAFAVLGLLGVVGCGNYEGPPCDEVDTRALAVDTSEAVPVMTFEGRSPNYVEVFAGDVSDSVTSELDWFAGDTVVWSLQCTCRDASGVHGCTDHADLTFRACLPSPLVYGEKNAPTARVETRPAALVPGAVYSAVVGTYCHGDRVQDDAVNSGDPFHLNHVETLAVFTAP